MRYRVAHRRAAKRSGLTQVLDRMTSTRFRLFFVLTILCCIAHAEVSDKAASLSQIWWTDIAIGIVALVLARYRFVLGLVMLPICLLIAYVDHDTLADPYIGEALIAEQGQAYVWAVYGGAFFMHALLAIGLWLGWRRSGLLGDEPAV